MAFVVEDGTGKTDSNAYITEAFFDTFHADRDRDVTSFTVPKKQGAIIRASDYIEKRFGRKFRGVRRGKEQAMEWPRLDGFDNDDHTLDGTDNVPRQLQKATAEYALQAALDGELTPPAPSPVPTQDLTDAAAVVTSTSGTGVVRSSTERVEGAVTDSKAFETSLDVAKMRDVQTASSVVPTALLRPIPAADLWIEELLRPPMGIQMVRGS